MTRRKLDEPQDEAPVLEEPLHIKYRPKRWKDVLGQDPTVKSLRDALGSRTRPHSFLFTGPSGTGKTTLARLVASELGINASNLIEVDAASNNGVDVMREIMAPLRYQGFGDSPNKAVILDEAHMLSKNAWNSLLKTVEEPPAHVYFFFCTTEANKVPDAIVTRCHSYNLRPLKYDDIMDLLEYVREAEDLPTTNKVLQMIAQACNGSPRLALVMLSQAHSAETEEEVARLLEMPMENAEVIELARDLVAGTLDWGRLTKTLKAMPEQSAESIRIVLVAYLTACLMGSKTDKSTVRLLDMLQCFSTPYAQSDKLAPLLLSFGRYLYP